MAASCGRLSRVHPPKLGGRLYEYLTYGWNIHRNTQVQPLWKYQILCYKLNFLVNVKSYQTLGRPLLPIFPGDF